MDPLDLARWQFGITTVYHFLFVPLTIGLAFTVAGLQTAWVRTNDEKWLRLTRFYGDLFLINFALGVVTGIVQEFQFGMNWSDYSRFVGDIFGAPLAIEGLLAFFLESTFIGLWIFGWKHLSKRLHLASIWLAATGTLLSAYFILAANAWMQHPVGFTFNEAAGRAELTDFLAVLTNSTAIVTFVHTIAAAFLTTGAFVAGIALWRLAGSDEQVAAFRTAARIGAATLLAGALIVVISGDQMARLMTEQQPMKMAAAEALYQNEQPASFSLFTVGTLDGSEEVWSIRVPGLLSFLATGDFNGAVEGINDIQDEYATQYGAGDYRPNIPIAYWTFRLMIGAGALAGLIALWMLWAMRRTGAPPNRWLVRSAIVLPFLPLAANSLGWIFTEMARQPWIVFGLMPTAAGVSPGTTAFEVGLSMVVFTLVYGALAVVELSLVLRRIRRGLTEPTEEPELVEAPAFTY